MGTGTGKQSPADLQRVFSRVVPAIPMLMLTSIMMFFGLLAHSLYKQETVAITRNFQGDIDQKAAVFEREIQLNLEILFALKSGLALLPAVTEDSFRSLSAAVLDRSPEIKAFAWAPWVVHSDRANFERLEKSRYAGPAISEQDSHGANSPASERSWYVPVRFIEPLAGNHLARGFDLASEWNRQAALVAARDQGVMVATAAITLVQEVGGQNGILVFAPLYRGNPQTLQDRRRSHYGFLNGVFRIGDLFHRSVQPGAADNMLLRLIDTTEADAKVLHANTELGARPWRDDMAYVRELADIAGRRWIIEAIPARGYIASQRSYLPELVILSGIILVALLLIFSRMMLRRNAELRAAKTKLEHVSMTDGLTGLANRRHFDQHLEKEWDRARRSDLPVSLIMIDIDYFKLFNDEYGHPAGDHCLRQVARALADISKRPADLVSRYGGEEFVIILPQTEDPGSVAQACRATIERLRIPHGCSPVADVVTISAGVCTLTPRSGMGQDLLTKEADVALYEAKKSGRNKVVMAPCRALCP